jgi:hypothetical protein
VAVVRHSYRNEKFETPSFSFDLQRSFSLFAKCNWIVLKLQCRKYEGTAFEITQICSEKFLVSKTNVIWSTMHTSDVLRKLSIYSMNSYISSKTT